MGWLELKDARRARDLLERSFANITEPFKVSLATGKLTMPASCWAPGWEEAEPSLRAQQGHHPGDSHLTLGASGSSDDGSGGPVSGGLGTDCLPRRSGRRMQTGRAR